MEIEHTDINVPVEYDKVKTKELPREMPVPSELKFNEKEPDNDTTDYEKTFAFIHLVANIIGWEFHYEWKTNARHWFMCAVNAFSWSQFLYSQVLAATRGEYRKIFEMFSVYGLSVSYTLKIVMFMRKYKALIALHRFTRRITQRAGKHLEKQIQNHHRQNLKVVKTISVCGISTLVLYGYYPLMEFITKRNLVSLLPGEIMFLDQTIFNQFLFANFLMAIMGSWTAFTLLVNILHFTVVIFNCSIQVDIIEDDIRQLDELWRDSSASVLERHRFLRNICQKCQDKENYIFEIKKIFDLPLYYNFCVAYMSEVVCLYQVKVDNWIPGIGLASGMFLEMLLYCMLGTKCSKINERLCNVLTHSHWYTYDMHSQKIYVNLIKSCMNSKELWIGPLAPLTVATGVQVVKSIYSYYAFLTEAA